MTRILDALDGTYPQCTGLQLTTGAADISPCVDGLGILLEDAQGRDLTSCQVGLGQQRDPFPAEPPWCTFWTASATF